MQMAAALSFYMLLSLAPLLVVVVALGGLVFGRDAVEGRVVGEMQSLIGQAGAEVVQTVIRNAQGGQQSVVSLVLGLLAMLVGATSVFVQLQSSLNQIWEVKAEPERKNAVWGFLRDRLLSLTIIVGVGFLLLVSLTLSAALTAAGSWMEGRMGLNPFYWQLIDVLASFVVITLLIAMIFKVLPDAKIAWRDVWFGAVVTALLFTGGKYLIGLYLGHASIGSAYGAAGSVVVLTVWVYYAALIFLFGAKLTQVRTRRERGKPPPVEYAVRSSHKPNE